MSKAMQFKARIRNMALQNRISAQSVLQNFMLERLLERISVSKHKDKFVLKGGMLIASLVGIDSRTTMDMDATVLGFPLSDESLRSAIGAAPPVAPQKGLRNSHSLMSSFSRRFLRQTKTKGRFTALGTLSSPRRSLPPSDICAVTWEHEVRLHKFVMQAH